MFRRAMVMVCTMVGATLPVATATAQVPPEPGADVTVVGDTVNGGAVFTVDLLNVDIDASELAVTASVEHGFFDTFEFSSVDTTCVANDDPGNDPAVTFTCEFRVPRIIDAGTYAVDVWSAHPDFPTTTLGGLAVLADDVVGWWSDHEVISFETDIFTGYTEFEVGFDDVPPEVSSLELQAWTFDGFATVSDSFPCTSGASGASGTFTCESGSPGIQPRCVEDPLGDSCDVADPTYYFTVNEVPTGFSIWAVHEPPTRWEEGAYFANQNYDDGELMQDFFDLDSFQLTSSDICRDLNATQCYDNAYYTTWLDRYIADFPATMDADGTFDVTVDGPVVTVDAAVPRLPLGEHGLSAQIAATPTSGGDSLVHDLQCDTTGCQQLAIDDLPSGEYHLDLRLFNDHPQVTVFDYDFAEITWGQDVVAAVTAPGTITVDSDIIDIVDIGGPEIRKGGKAAKVTFGLADETGAPIPDEVARALIRPTCHVQARLDGALQSRCAKYNPGHDTFSLETALLRTDPGPWTLTIEITAPDGSGVVNSTDVTVTRQ